jgi:type IV pilus assembly protein PilV
MIEVLVAIVIIAFGLLGLAGLQMRMQASETEAYQRSQALLLVSDMAGRLAANRTSAAAYASDTATYGTDADGTNHCTGMASGTIAQIDLKEWCAGLLGSSETTTTGGVTKQQGAMIGGRGCVQNVGGDYLVTVVWQGLTPISAPPAQVTCGASSYNTGSLCVEDRCRRYVTTVVRIASLL